MKSWDGRDTTDRLIERITTSAEAALIFQPMAINKITRRNGSNKSGQCIKLRCQGGIKVKVFWIG